VIFPSSKTIITETCWSSFFLQPKFKQIENKNNPRNTFYGRKKEQAAKKSLKGKDVSRM
jgi:hypothetical protein